MIEGHTDAKPFAGNTGYGNWELSTDRANSARKLMETNGVRDAQVTQVRGYADRQLRHPEDPSAASNRRISVIVQYLKPPPGVKKESAEEGGKKADEGAGKEGGRQEGRESPPRRRLRNKARPELRP